MMRVKDIELAKQALAITEADDCFWEMVDSYQPALAEELVRSRIAAIEAVIEAASNDR